MITVRTINGGRAEEGLAYVVMLSILVIAFSLAFSFLMRVGVEAAATASRSSSMQVHYLAESAANHAKWRLLTDPTFPADEDTYYMHSFAGGRYGYKVRRHTDTTFATIATVGVLGDNVVQQSYVLYVIPSSGPIPIAHWKLDENGGILASDSSGNGHAGTLTNMNLATDWVTGHVDGALDFDGDNDVVNVAHDDALSLTGDLTIAAWANSNGLVGIDCIVGKGDSGTTWNYNFGTNGHRVFFEFYDGDWREFQGAPNLTKGVWYHLAVTFEPGNDLVRLFVDGSEVLNTTTTRSAIANTEDVWIGSNPWGEDWKGMLDDIRIYDQILSDAEISVLAGM